MKLLSLARLLQDSKSAGTASAGSMTDAERTAMQKIEKAGGSVRKIAQNDDRIEVDFHLQGEKLTDEHLAPIRELKKVVHVHLGNTSVSDRGLAHLQELTELTRLNLEQTKISDAGLSHLKNLKALTYLNLYGTAITDAGLVHLKNLANLRNLYLWQTKVTPAGVASLRKALPEADINTGWELETASPPKDTQEKTELPKKP